jgi:hypothetical protein
MEAPDFGGLNPDAKSVIFASRTRNAIKASNPHLSVAG